MAILDMIQKYPRKSLESSLKEVMKSKNKMISGKFSPIVYNLEYKEISYKSIDGLNLYAWLIKREKAKKTIILLHGRENNRIFCLKFLQIFADLSLLDEYNIVIPDLRNSGKSDECLTSFGYDFAKDIYSTMEFLKKEYELNNFILYGFSQGAMGAAYALSRYENEIKKSAINVEKLIVDSPVSNVKEIILYHSNKNRYIPKIFKVYLLHKFNQAIDNNLKYLRLSQVLGKVPTLIIQSEKDDVTPYEIVKKEYEILKEKEKKGQIASTNFKAFRKGQHVRIYLEYKEEYTQEIKKFLEKENL